MNRTKHMKAGLLAAALTAALPLSDAWAAHRSEAEQAIAEAKALNAKAASAGAQTGETAGLIAQAKELVESRQYTKAIELATKAKKQDQYALTQKGAPKTQAAEAAKPAAEAPKAAEAAKPSAEAPKAAEAAKPSAEAPKAAEAPKGPGPQKATAGEAESAIASAEDARKKAASVGGEWRDVGKMIKEAKDLVKTGELDAAVKLAGTARRQGELGYHQSIAETDAGFPDYMLKKKQ